MSIFDLLGIKKDIPVSTGVIADGRNKNTGGHDHRTNKGDDRTPAQKNGDKARRK